MIAVNQVTKYYGKTKALDSVSFELKHPESVVILGPSGSGKTTLLRLIAGLEIPDEGEIYIDGSLVSKKGWASVPHQREIGFVFQKSALWPHLTVAQNILFGLGNLPRKQRQQRLNKLLKRMHLSELRNRYPDEISGGEARLTAIARSLAPSPKYLLMDEPLINLDPELKQKMLAFIQETSLKNRSSLIYVTHDKEESEKISWRKLILREGKLERI